MIQELQRGILTFVEDYTRAFAQYPWMLRICGEDAYHVCRFIVSQPEYFRNLFGEYPVNRAVGTSSYEMETLAELMEREYRD